MEVNQKVRSFIENNLIVLEDEADFQDSDNIFQMGYVNSLFAMKLLSYVEAEFNITVDNDEMDIRNFSSINAIVELVQRKSQLAKAVG